MKKLWVIRHAKSSWKIEGQRDYERPLNRRGLLSAKFMSDLLSEQGVKPDVIISSPAVRAKNTAEIFGKNLQITDLLFDESIYGSHFQTLANITADFDDKWDSVMLFGHNPGMSDLCQYLTGLPCQLVTCAIAEIDLNITSWKHSGSNVGTLASYDFPKNHSKFLNLLDE